MFDLAIIGGGPAGSAAGVYAARKLIKTVFITESFGGQSIVSSDIQNWIGTPSLSGETLAKDLEKHVRAYAGDVVSIETGNRVSKVETMANGFRMVTTNGNAYEAKTILVASGGTRRTLDIPGAKEFEHKGVTYCASCDGPLFAGMDVAVVGGGNAGFETAAQLLAYAKSVTLINRGNEFKADPVTVAKVLAHPNMRALSGSEPTAVLGEKFVTGLTYRTTEGKEETLSVSGVFVEIGMIPNTDFVKGVVETDELGRVVVDCKTQRASTEGVWAAGDCTNGKYHQNNIAAGDAVKALEDIYLFLNAR